VKEERLRAEHASRDLTAAREEISLLRERCDTLEHALEEEEARRTALEGDLESAKRSTEESVLRERVRALEASSRTASEEHEADIARLEAQLKDRGHEVQELKSEVDRRDLLVREVIATNLTAQSPEGQEIAADDPNGAVADLSAQLDRLAGEAARR